MTRGSSSLRNLALTYVPYSKPSLTHSLIPTNSSGLIHLLFKVEVSTISVHPPNLTTQIFTVAWSCVPSASGINPIAPTSEEHTSLTPTPHKKSTTTFSSHSKRRFSNILKLVQLSKISITLPLARSEPSSQNWNLIL